MATVIQNLPEIRVGRDWILQVNETTQQGNPLSLAGYTIELIIKKSLADPDASALWKSATLYSDNRPFGSYAFHIPKTTTSGYQSFSLSGQSAQYEIVYEDPTGITQTRFAGTVPITNSITLVIP